MYGPTIHGTQIVLQQPRPEYISSYLKWLADLDITRYLPFLHPPSQQMEAEWLEQMARSRADVVWGIHVGDRLVGMVGMHEIDWINRNCVMGLMIGERDRWANGIGTEAVTLAIRHAFEWLNLEKVKGYALVPNVGIIRIALKFGFREVGVLKREWFREGQWMDRWIGELLRDEWLATHGRAAP